MNWKDYYRSQAHAVAPRPKRPQAAKPKPQQKLLSRAEIEAKLVAIEARTASAFRALGVSDAGIDEIRDRVNAGDSVDSLMRDIETYSAGSTLAREQLAMRMGAASLDARTTRSTETKLSLGCAPPSMRSQAHDRSALAARMGVRLEGAEPSGAGVRSAPCKLTLGPLPN